MALTITSRPSKEIDGTTSSWNAINLPIQYKFTSDLFPVNSVDPISPILSFSNSNGFLKVTTSVALTNVLTDEFIELSLCDVDSFNGNWRVKEMISTTEFIIRVNYDSNLTSGSIQKYYNNYFVEVDLYSGLPSWHDKAIEKPISQTGTLRIIPNVDNEIIASFSGVIKADVNTNNQLSDGIEIDLFTGFYIQWREGYDENINGNVETFYTPVEIDEVTNCGNNIVTNGDFLTDLSGWTQVDAVIPSESFVWNSGVAETNLNTSRKSKVIYQEVNLLANIEYAFNVDVTRSNSKSSKFVIYGSNDLINFYILYSEESINNINVSENITPNNDYKYVGYHFYRAQTPVSTTITLDNISVTPVVCERTFWASNSSLQFQNLRGGNMYDYIAKDSESKFMTNFNTPTIFNGEYFDTSIILDSESIGDVDISSSAYMWLVASDIEQADNTAVSSWVDRTGNVNVTAGAGTEPVYKSSSIDYVHFNNINQFFNTDINITQPYYIYVAIDFESYTSTLIDSIGFNRTLIFLTDAGDKILLNSGANLLSESIVLLNQLYVLKLGFNGAESSIYLDNVIDAEGNVGSNVVLQNMTIGRNLNISDFLHGKIYEMAIIPQDMDGCLKWQFEKYLGDKYGTYSINSFAYTQSEYNSNGLKIGDYNSPIDFNGVGLYRLKPTINNLETTKIDIQLFNSETCTLSEVKEFNVNKDCYNQEIYLTWLNELGGWDYWKFTAEKDYILDINSKETIKRNIFNDWDNTFINGDTQLDVIGTDANKSIGVFSQYLNKDEIEAISTIKYSTKVQIIEGTKKTTVIVDSDTLTLFNDGDDETLYTIRFNIQLPSIQVQSQ